MYILNFIRGFCMALADSVPGVSGGTIAFILGFYDDFVNALHSLISNNKSGRIKAFKFLAKHIRNKLLVFRIYNIIYSINS